MSKNQTPLLSVVATPSKTAGNPTIRLELEVETSKGKMRSSCYVVSGKKTNKNGFAVGETVHVYGIVPRETEEAKQASEMQSLRAELAALRAQLAAKK